MQKQKPSTSDLRETRACLHGEAATSENLPAPNPKWQ